MKIRAFALILFRKVLNDMFDFILVGKQMINETCKINANSLAISAKMQTFISKILTDKKTYRQFLTKFNYYSYNINSNDIIALVKVLMYINNEENIKIKISSFTDKKTFTLKEFENIMSFSI